MVGILINGRTTRRSTLAAAAAVLLHSGQSHADRPAEFTLRLGLNQPFGSPTEVRVNELAASVLAETEGRLQIKVFAGGRLGSDNAMLDELRAGRLDLYLAGNNLGGFSALSEMPSLPFAFEDDEAVFKALDGEFGALIRRDLARGGLHAFNSYWTNGFHHLTTNSRPIQEASDLRGLTIRTPVQTMPAEFFRLFGAEPKGITFDAMYSALRDHLVDGQTDPLGVVQSLRLYEVQRFLSLTGHWWSGFLMVSPLPIWEKLPSDLQSAFSRNVNRVALMQRQDVAGINRRGTDFLQNAGMVVNSANLQSFQTRLGDFYARWRAAYGNEAWTVLEKYTGRLG